MSCCDPSAQTPQRTGPNVPKLANTITMGAVPKSGSAGHWTFRSGEARLGDVSGAGAVGSCAVRQRPQVGDEPAPGRLHSLGRRQSRSRSPALGHDSFQQGSQPGPAPLRHEVPTNPGSPGPGTPASEAGSQLARAQLHHRSIRANTDAAVTMGKVVGNAPVDLALGHAAANGRFASFFQHDSCNAAGRGSGLRRWRRDEINSRLGPRLGPT